jgi:hypothetical protein
MRSVGRGWGGWVWREGEGQNEGGDDPSSAREWRANDGEFASLLVQRNQWGAKHGGMLAEDDERTVEEDDGGWDPLNVGK